MPLKTKYDKTKTFVKKYRIPVACTAGVIAGSIITYRTAGLSVGFAIIRNPKSIDVAEGLEIMDMEDHLEHLTLMEFVDSKKLRDEFFAFSKMMNGDGVAA